MLSFILAITITMPTPTPSPGPPVIYELSSSPRCSTLAKLMLPVGFVTKHNDEAFHAAADSMGSILRKVMPGDVPTTADIDSALGYGPNNKGASGQTIDDPRTSSANGSGTALSSEFSASSGDDSLLYGPRQILDAANVDQVVQAILANVRLEKSYVQESLKTYPPHRDARVDQLRATTEELIVLQQALANRYEQFSGTYIDNIGMADMMRNSQDQLAQFKLVLRGLLLGESSGLAGTPAANDGDANFGYGNVSALAAGGTNGQIVQALRAREIRFSRVMIAQYNECHGTKFNLQNPATPAPVPSPTPHR